MRFDAIVVGAGTAGCMAARTMAGSGLRVAVVERRPREEVGRKVCGEAVSKAYFGRVGLSPPLGEELAGQPTGILIFSPDRRTVFEVRGEGLMLNRYEFGQRLLREALGNGAELFDRTLALEPIMEGTFVRGIVAKDLRKEVKLELRADVVIDASGFSAILRHKIPGFEVLRPEEFVVCYREIRSLSESVDPDFCLIFLDQEASPGGYSWVFPKGEEVVNVGLGVQALLRRDPRRCLYAHLLKERLFEGSKVLEAGFGAVPTRRPIGPMVADGLLLVGDAACLTNPVTGGGIGPSLISGKLAGEAAVKAVEIGDVSRRSLWRYPSAFMKEYGAKQAALDAFRIFLQSLTNEELNYGMRKRFIDEEELSQASVGGEISPGFFEKVARFFRGLGRPGLLRKLLNAARLMRELKSLYSRYPQPEEFEAWRSKVEQVISKARKLFPPWSR